jgi:four helix bundle protein
MNHSIIAEKSFNFAKSIVYLYKQLTENNKEYIMSKQILRSGTSIGANIKEALRGQSKKDFLAKMCISMKEADETEYWLKLLMETGYINEKESEKLLEDCQEISKILNAIIKTTKIKLASTI